MAGEKHYNFGKKRPGVGGRKPGGTAWNKGMKGQYKQPEGTGAKISKALMGRVGGMTGKKQSAEWIENHRKFMEGQPISFYRNCLRRRTMSGLEKRVDDLIQKYELPYKFVGNGKFWIERKNPDFVNTNGKKIAVEVYYKRHKNEFSGGVDRWIKTREKIFANYGWKTLFLEGSNLTNDIIVETLKKGGE